MVPAFGRELSLQRAEDLRVRARRERVARSVHRRPDPRVLVGRGLIAAGNRLVVGGCSDGLVAREVQ